MPRRRPTAREHPDVRGGDQQRLGSSFDLRTFHDVVLGDGALPLSVLEDVVRAWSPH
ncbi:DUF885 family protein [Actinophytocola gossypii]|uniref:DUF885 family protein n=1 Tax=Actinophytocola gossypii TaxID=2812003 RepID=UPI00288318A7|nr:DUF885 family protein [Actinophytocola gossypii]